MILTGAGPKAFVAGADIGEIAGQGPVDGKARALEGQRVVPQRSSAAASR